MRILFLNCPKAIPTLQFKNISNFFEKYFIKNFFMKGEINWSRNAVCFASGTLRSFGILRCLLCWTSKRALPFSFKNYFCFVWETLWANWVWALILKYTVLIVLEFSMSEAKFWVPLLEKIVQDCNREDLITTTAQGDRDWNFVQQISTPSEDQLQDYKPFFW